MNLFHQLFFALPSIRSPFCFRGTIGFYVTCAPGFVPWLFLWETIAFALKPHMTFLEVFLFFAYKATELPNPASVGPTYSLFLDMVCFLARMHINLRQVKLLGSGHL